LVFVNKKTKSASGCMLAAQRLSESDLKDILVLNAAEARI
jgi:hypothetical protein